MRSWIVACAGVLGACGFTATNTNTNAQDAAPGGGDADPTGDGSIDIDASIVVDAPPGTPCYGEFETVCLAAPATGSFTINGGVTDNINTDTDGRCTTPLAAGSTITNACVLAFASVGLNGTLRATGDRPLILIGTGSITINGSGVIDVGSRGLSKGAGGRSCTPTSTPTNDGGGGAGASFQFGGGNGGSGNSGVGGVTNTQQNLTDLVGGCQGFDGAPSTSALRGRGGFGGGAVLLISMGSITVDGKINASGGGASGGLGNRTGAGGGGAGGAIVLDTENLTIHASGIAFAQGGGGGEGAQQSALGGIGDSGVTGGTRADGGSGGTGGDGGDGGVAGGGSGGSSGGNDGGGGGGGGAGYVKTTDSAPSNGGNAFPTLQSI